MYWDGNLKSMFEQAKTELCKLVSDGLSYYDKSRPTIVLTDCRDGMGFCGVATILQLCVSECLILLFGWVEISIVW